MGKILIVDDEEVDRELAMRCMADVEGAEFLHAADGQEALDIIAAQQPEVVVTDLRIPRMDGLELVGRIRQRFSSIPIVLMTSKGSEQLAVRALQVGATSYVPKDDLKRYLGETIEQLLDLARTRRSRAALLKHLFRAETRFNLPNDPSLIPPLAGHLQENLERIGFGDEVVRDQIGIALIEAVSNAMIHGNLEVESSIREKEGGHYHDLIHKRRDEQPYASRRVVCEARESPQRVTYIVQDEGPGFDPFIVPDPTWEENVTRVRGRGLLLIRTFMDEVEFNDRGNHLRMTKRAPDAS